ncbi:MAG: hypothetical protein QXZ70_00900 [Candidatus Bathyarchaeia archaeon]
MAINLLYGNSVGNSLKALDDEGVRAICSIHSILGSKGIQRYSYIYSYSVNKILRKFSQAEAANIAMTPVELIRDASQLRFGELAQIFIPLTETELLSYLHNPNVFQFIDEFKQTGVLTLQDNKLVNPWLVKDVQKASEISSSLEQETTTHIQRELSKVFTARIPVKLKNFTANLENSIEKGDMKHLAKELPKFLPIALHEHEGATYMIPSPPSTKDIKPRHLDFLLELMEDPLSLLETTALLSEQATPVEFFENIPSVVPDALIDPIEKKWNELQSYFLINRFRNYITTVDGERLLCIAYGTPFAYLEYVSMYPTSLPKINIQSEKFWQRIIGFTFWGVVWRALRQNLAKGYDNHEVRQKTARAFQNMFSVNVYDVAEELGIHPSTVPALARTLRASGYGGSISLYSHPRLYKETTTPPSKKLGRRRK